MITYSLTTGIRNKVLIVIFVISILLSYYIYPLGSQLLELIKVECPSLGAFMSKWEFLGFISSPVTTIAIFMFLRWLFNNYIWKTKLLQRVINVPNLDGKWVGVLISSFHNKENNCRVEINFNLYIQQTWEKMSCKCEFPKSESYSDMICLDTKSSQGIVLRFTYTNKSGDIEYNLTQFAGYNEFVLKDRNTLLGTYYTKRDPDGSRGTMLLTRVLKDTEIKEEVTQKV